MAKITLNSKLSEAKIKQTADSIEYLYDIPAADTIAYFQGHDNLLGVLDHMRITGEHDMAKAVEEQLGLGSDR